MLSFVLGLMYSCIAADLAKRATVLVLRAGSMRRSQYLYPCNAEQRLETETPVQFILHTGLTSTRASVMVREC